MPAPDRAAAPAGLRRAGPVERDDDVAVAQPGELDRARAVQQHARRWWRAAAARRRRRGRRSCARGCRRRPRAGTARSARPALPTTVTRMVAETIPADTCDLPVALRLPSSGPRTSAYYHARRSVEPDIEDKSEFFVGRSVDDGEVIACPRRWAAARSSSRRRCPGASWSSRPSAELAPHEGAGGALMMALPMLGSVGSIVFVAAAQPGGKGMIAAGMFLVATLGFVGVSVDRQRKQRAAKVTGARREYLQYLSGVRKVVRETATQQRQRAAVAPPLPRALPAIAEDRTRVVGAHAGQPAAPAGPLRPASQPLALELLPRRPLPSSSSTRWPPRPCTGYSSCTVSSPTCRPPSTCGPSAASRSPARPRRRGPWPGRWSARWRRSTPPSDLLVAVLATTTRCPEWEWLKWLPHAQSTEDSDALGPSRMVTTSLDDLAAMLPKDLVDRPRFGADQRAAAPHVLVLVDGATLPPGNHLIPDEGVHGVTVLDLPERWDELDDPTRLRLNIEPGLLPDGQVARHRAAGARGRQPGGRRPARPGQRRGVRPTARSAAHQRADRSARTRSPAPPTCTTCSASATSAPSTSRPAWQPAPAARPAPGAGRRRRRRRAGLPRHQGVRPAGHGPARPGHRRHRLRQVGVPAHAGPRPGDDALARGRSTSSSSTSRAARPSPACPRCRTSPR